FASLPQSTASLPFSPAGLYLLALAILLSASFFFHAAAATEFYTLSLHDALPICVLAAGRLRHVCVLARPRALDEVGRPGPHRLEDRKSTRLNSSHVEISYAVFCLKKKKTKRYVQKHSNTTTALNIWPHNTLTLMI